MNAMLAPDMQTAIAEYSATEAGLIELRARLKDRVYNVTTTKGLDEAKKDRAELRDLRVSLEKKRKEIKAPALEYCNRIDSEAKRITAEIVEMESPIDSQIKAEEQRKAEEKAERERAEAARLAAITQEITNLQRYPLDFTSATADELRAGIQSLEADALADFDEVHQPTAQAAKDASLAKLRAMLTEREELDRQRAEMERQREAMAAAQREQEARDAEARAQREREDAERRAAQEAEDRRRAEELAAQRAEQDRVAAEQAERQRQLDAQAAEHRERELAAERARIEEATRAAREQRERDEAARREAEDRAIQESTLTVAARSALALLKDEGYGDRFQTRALEHALSREVSA